MEVMGCALLCWMRLLRVDETTEINIVYQVISNDLSVPGVE